MTSKEQFELKRVSIEAITDKDTVIPSIPVAVVLQEAEDLYEWCLSDKELLVKAGLDPMLIEDLPDRIGACRFVQTMWQKEYNSIDDTRREWNAKSPAAYKLRDNILHHFFHAYRRNADLLVKVQRIADGNGHADMIQDLSDMSMLGTSNPDPLLAIGFDMKLLEEAAETSSAMSELLAKANASRMNNGQLKSLRDKAYTYLKSAVDEIRHHGQYLFWKNEERKKGYVSRYVQQHFTRIRKTSRNTEETAE